MPPPAPLGTGDAQAEAAQSTNSCSRQHGKYLICFAAIVQVLLYLLGLHSMLTIVPRKRTAPTPRAAPGSVELLRFLELLWAPLAVRALASPCAYYLGKIFQILLNHTVPVRRV